VVGQKALVFAHPFELEKGVDIVGVDGCSERV
jgi:hypothetical protein